MGSTIWDRLERLAPSVRGELELTEAIAALIEDGCRVVAADVLGPWFDIGTPESLAAANSVYG